MGLPFNTGLLIRPATKLSQLVIDEDKLWPTVTVTHSPAWALSGWIFRKKFTVAGTAAGAQANYQMRLEVHFGPGTDSPGVVYLGGHAKDDFSDLRFLNSAGAQLHYWIDTYLYSAHDRCYIWVELDSIPVSPGTADFWMYYDNAAAATGSSGTATFEAFEDFESGALAAWTERDPIAATWTAPAAAKKDGAYGAQGIMVAAGQGGILTWNATSFYQFRAEGWIRIPDADTLADVQGGFVIGWIDNNNYYVVKATDVGATERLTIQEKTGGVAADRATPVYTWAPGTWYKLTTKVFVDALGLRIKGDINDVNVADYTDASPTIGKTRTAGQDAINRASTAAALTTHLELGNPIAANGFVQYVEVWATTALTGAKIGIFYNTGVNQYKCRSAVTIGNIAAGSALTFLVNLACQAGDVIGIYFATGTLESAAAGGTSEAFAGDVCNVGDEQVFIAGAKINSFNGGTVNLAAVGLFAASTINSRLWADTFKVTKYANPEPIFGAWVAEEEFAHYYGMTNVKELAAGMVKGDVLFCNGTILAKLSPGSIGTEVMSHDWGADPTFEYPP